MNTVTNSSLTYVIHVAEDKRTVIIDCPWCSTIHALNDVPPGPREVTIDHTPDMCLAWVDGILMKGPFE